MPKVDVKRDLFFAEVGRHYTQEQFEHQCFEYGIELDDITSEREQIKKETGEVKENVSDEVLYKIEVPANRYDLLCLEGLSTALKVFINKDGSATLPSYHLILNEKPLRLIIDKSTREVRPFCVAAVLRNVSFNQERYDSFIDLQEKLHQNICRKRALVSIGTHDLSTISSPFTYSAEKPEHIKFVPLSNNKEFNAVELFEHFHNTNSHLKKYTSIIKDFPVYPVIRDSNGVILSLPPIINGEHSKITLNTKDIFIEVTATDYTKAHVVLNTIVAMFSKYCANQWSVEPVEVVDVDGKVSVTPNFTPTVQIASVSYINSALGLKLTPEEILVLLRRMSLPSEIIDDEKDSKNKAIKVIVPITRSDILHACDIVEDVAIAYGYNNLVPLLPPTNTIGRQQPINKVCDLLRAEIAMAGYTEVLTFALCSLDDNFKNLNRVDDGNTVLIGNPKTAEFQCGRASLLSGVLKSVSANKGVPLPLKLFEIGDTFGLDPKADVLASNQRHICALYCSSTGSGFEVIHGLLDRIMLLLRITRLQGESKERTYEIKPFDDPAFFPGRSVGVFVNGKKIGGLGVVHPLVLQKHEIPFPCSALELEITLPLAY